MAALPPALFLTIAAGLGLYLGWLYLRGIRRKPVMIGLHLLLGAAGLETTVMLLRGLPNGTSSAAGAFGGIAAGLLAAALFTGLIAPMLCRGSRRTANVVVASHAGVGLAGCALFIAWALGL